MKKDKIEGVSLLENDSNESISHQEDSDSTSTNSSSSDEEEVIKHEKFINQNEPIRVANPIRKCHVDLLVIENQYRKTASTNSKILLISRILINW